jgi:DNA polymerase/3'-5' exonuclease PolX
MGIGKIDLDSAKIVSKKILDHLSPAMTRIEIAGSIRRQKPVVGDIELVGIPDDREKLMSLLRDIGQTIKPGVPGIVPWDPKLDSKYIRVRLEEEMNLDLFLGKYENFGGLYLMRTGSASGADGNSFNGFVPGCFSRFKKLSGGGRMTDVMPTMPTGEQLWVPEEQDFFDLLEMNFVPPEERISRNVIKKYIKA